MTTIAPHADPDKGIAKSGSRRGSRMPRLISTHSGHGTPMNTAPISSPASEKTSAELIAQWTQALLCRNAAQVEDIVSRARRMHPSSGLIGD